MSFCVEVSLSSSLPVPPFLLRLNPFFTEGWKRKLGSLPEQDPLPPSFLENRQTSLSQAELPQCAASKMGTLIIIFQSLGSVLSYFLVVISYHSI